MDRRSLLRAGAAAIPAAAGGCLSPDDGGTGSEGDDSGGNDLDGRTEIAQVEDPPAAVYVPSHRETMRHIEPIEVGDYALAPMVSYAHPFWFVDGDETVLVEPEGGPEVHLMFTLWEPESRTVLPVESGTTIRLERDGERVGSSISPWPMISQGMGAHFGDNVPLEGDGTYAVKVELPPIDVRTTGDLDGLFEEFVPATFEFTYDEAFREEVVDVDYLDEELWGQRGALEPMDHGGRDDHGDEDNHDGNGTDGEDDHDDGDHDGDGNDSESEDDQNGHDEGDDGHGGHIAVPYSALPPAEKYPGVLGKPESHDAVLVTALFEPGTRFVEGDERYLLVSPRTPYNRVPLADMVMTATVERDGETVVEADLEQTIDGEYGLHYGAGLGDVEDGDALAIAVDGVPQVARHQGYETAFLEMDPVKVTVGGST